MRWGNSHRIHHASLASDNRIRIAACPPKNLLINMYRISYHCTLASLLLPQYCTCFERFESEMIFRTTRFHVLRTVQLYHPYCMRGSTMSIVQNLTGGGGLYSNKHWYSACTYTTRQSNKMSYSTYGNSANCTFPRVSSCLRQMSSDSLTSCKTVYF